MNCCTSRCGWCGRCDDERWPEPEPPAFCDVCGGDIIPGVTAHITLGGVGTFCSTACADAGSEKHAASMQRKSA